MLVKQFCFELWHSLGQNSLNFITKAGGVFEVENDLYNIHVICEYMTHSLW